ncbi:aminotransferase class V-fold PLP-dependent enzyme [Nocardioides sp. GY 10113]|uniref:cysteine desulfurase family protein n=1 Tax=Nocardioides sp. GY 10113 TaxID=2569761 RepID=UPI001F0FD500|nr:aminotransferase class V-fold PLP-dependent enzyme [Nocardioides sp. GY 10113]
MHSAPTPGGSHGEATAAVYLDAASSTALHPAARDVLTAALERGYGDPRRLHRTGRDARLLLDNARAVVAECLGIRPDEVAFTASGTEAVQRGLLGLVEASTRDGIAHTTVEHSSVLHAVAWRPGAHVALPVDGHGRVAPADVAEAARRPGTAAVAVQAANQEIGTRQPVDDLDLPVGVPLLVDAAAALGHGPLPRRWDALTASAHTWGGPAGVGVLALRHGTRWHNPFPGEDRPEPDGFPNVPAALAAAAALQATLAEEAEVSRRQHALVDRIRTAASALPDTEVVGDPEDRLPHLVTFSCLYLAGDELVTELDRQGFGVASGSACTASTLEPSHVLAAIGALTHGNVRVSLTRETTAEQVDAFCRALTATVSRLREGLL